ncbi:MAG: DUF2520 domain-containing protein, partial [Bacteroidota bacterium]
GKARRLARSLTAEATKQIDQIDPTADLYILAVKDDAIEQLADQLEKRLAAHKPLIVHTSGATPSHIFKGRFKRYGVFYPLQSFSMERDLDFSTVPLCVHANRKADRQLLLQLGKRLCENVYLIDDAQRAVLHVAAVFVNNFSNHLFRIGQEICEAEGLSFDLLRPLILETARKVQEHPPAAMQTGPAIRQDEKTLARHLNYLAGSADHQQIYHIFTQHIRQLPTGD